MAGGGGCHATLASSPIMGGGREGGREGVREDVTRKGEREGKRGRGRVT